MRIYKYHVPPEKELSLRMPKGARLLSVQSQNGEPQVWALVDPDASFVMRRFATRGTGHDAFGLDDAVYVGTYQLSGGAMVFHLFDRGEP